MKCDKPPNGWSCSRDPGHPGPCAAYPPVVGTCLTADECLALRAYVMGDAFDTAFIESALRAFDTVAEAKAQVALDSDE